MKAQRAPPRFETLEARILYSADAALLLGAHGLAEPAQVRVIDAAPVVTAAHEIIFIFIDSRVPDAMRLADELARTRGNGSVFDIVVIGADEDGVQQIGQVLAHEQGLAAIHLISHGSDGALELGNSRLDAARLAAEGGAVGAWGAALAPGGDLLLYGCDVAQGAAGQLFVRELAGLTGADVAASTGLTGSAALGGDWTLEYATGAIHTQLTAQRFDRLDWAGVLATYTVTNTNNAGAGSLRQAIGNANANAGADNIVFAIGAAPVGGVYTISLASGLPQITGQVVLDATTQPGFAGAPLVVIDGSGAGNTDGLTLAAGSSGSTVRGLVLGFFNGGINDEAIRVASNNNLIAGNWIGLDGTGSLVNANYAGISVSGSGNTIGGTSAADRNVISGNSTYGINIDGVGASSNLVIGNYVGTDASGNAAVGNGQIGIRVNDNGSGNRIGGSAAGEGNRVANTLAGPGISYETGSGTAAFLGNLVYANAGSGIDLLNDGVTANDAGDADSGPNGLQNFPVLASANANSAGTTLAGTLNSNANKTYRIEFFGNRPAVADANNGEAERYLGFTTVTTNGSGNASFNLTLAGVWVNGGDKVSATATVDLGGGSYGATSEFAANVTATTSGIVVVDTASDTADGTTSSIANLGNSRGADGRISLREAITAANNTANNAANGGTPDKIVFAIPGSGVHTINLGSLLPTVSQALVIDASSQAGYAGMPLVVLNGGGSVQDGLRLYAGSGGSTVRGLAVQNFSGDGIDVASSDGNTIAGNWLGLASSGTAAAGNANGLNFFAASNNTVGGSSAADRNVISGNSAAGIRIGDGSSGNQVLGNYIGTDASGTLDIDGSGQASGRTGVVVSGSASNNSIGGLVAAARNVISGNNWFGIELLDGTSGNTVQGNYIGTDVSGQLALGNSAGGVSFYGNGTSGNLLGGGMAGAGNVVSANETGVLIANGASNNAVQGNLIGLAADGSSTLGNSLAGVHLRAFGGANPVSGNLIGSDGDGSNDAAEGNVISANGGAGVVLQDSVVSGNTVAGNRVGTDAGGTLARGNQSHGVLIQGSANGNQVGGTAAAQRNLIAFNTAAGIAVTGAASTGNALLGNALQGNGGLGIDLGNDGVTANDPNDADSGPNGLQNTPLLRSAGSSGGNTVVMGSLDSTGSTNYRIEFFASPVTDPSGHGEASTYLGFTTVTTNALGDASFAATLGGVSVAAGYAVTATATVDLGAGSYGSSSEFATNVQAQNQAQVTAVKDSYISSSSTANNYGASASLNVTGGSSLQRALLQFDFSSLPAGAAITGATLLLDASSASGGPINVNVYELTNAWTEGTSNFFSGVSWGDRSPFTPWASAGADFNPAVVANLYGSALGSSAWDVTSLVHDWVAGTRANNGLLLASPDSSGTPSVTYSSRQGATAPRLVLTYAFPNTAPVLDAARTPVLGTMAEDAGAPSGAVGTLVSSLVDFAVPAGQVDNVTDADAGALLGIAITAADTSHGNWWTSLDNGASWQALGSVGNASARLLNADASTRLYFEPAADWNGTLASAIVFRAWDRSTGLNGGLGDTTANGGASAYSSATDSAALTVAAVNDAPTLGNTGAFAIPGGNEDGPSAATLVSDLLLGAAQGDVDSGAQRGIAVLATSGNGSFQYSTDGITWAGFGSVSAGNALLLDSGSQVRYLPDGANGETAGFSFKAWDRSSGTASSNAGAQYANPGAGGGSSAYSLQAGTAQLAVTAVNDAPVLANAGPINLAATDEDTPSSATLVSDLLQSAGPSDVDSGASAGIAVTATSGHGSFQYSSDGIGWVNFGSVSAANALLLDSASRVRFLPDGIDGETASFVFRAWDQSSGSASTNATPQHANAGSGGGSSAFSTLAATVQIAVTAVNDAPLIASATGTLAYVENSGPVLIGGTATVSDVDSADFDGAQLTLRLSSNGQPEDRLTLQHQGNGAGQVGIAGGVVRYGGVVVGSFNGPVTGATPLVVSFNANASAAIVQAVARRVSYENTSEDPSPLTRSMQATLTDGDGGSSNTLLGSIAPSQVNDAPTIAVVAPRTTNEDVVKVFSVFIGNAITVGDVDAGNGVLRLTVTAQHGTVTLGHLSGLAFSVGDGTNDVTMSFTGTLANLNNALDGIAYQPDAHYNGPAALDFVLDDQGNSGSGGALGASATQLITVLAVNDAPVITDGTALALISTDEDTASAPLGVAGILADSALAYADADASALRGLAVTATLGRGRWQYSDDGANWADVGTVSAGNALLLDAATLLRYVPDGRNGEAASLAFRAWDQSSGTASTNVAPAFANPGAGGGPGGSSAFSSGAASLLASVSSVNDAPAQVLLTPPAAANLVVNGSFEINNAPANGYVGGPFASVAGWTSIGGDGFEVWNDFNNPYSPGPAAASDGVSRLELDVASNLDGIRQDIATVAGRTYLLSFDFANRQLPGNPESGVDVFWRGTRIATVQQSAVAWQTYRFAVTGSGGNDTLAFVETAASNDSAGSHLDNVRLVDADTAPPVVAENSANGTVVARAAATDVDDGDSIVWTLTDSAGGRFAIDAATGAISVADASRLDFESAASHAVTLRATDAGGLWLERTVTLALQDVNEAPQAVADAASATEAGGFANATPGSAAVGNLLANDRDPDAGDSLTVVGVTAGATGSAAGGVSAPLAGQYGTLTVDANGSYRYAVDDANATVQALRDAAATLDDSFTYTVRDNAGLLSSARLTVTIHGADDAPMLTSAAAVTVAENSRAVLTVTACDADLPAQALGFAIIGGADAARFTINAATGALAFFAAPDFELPTDANGDGVYDLIVSASDGVLSSTQALTVTVSNVNEAPTLGLPGAQAVAEDGTLRFASAFGNALRLADLDGSSAVLQLNLGVSHGRLTIGGHASAPSLTLSGTVTALSAALNDTLTGLRFDPDADFNGAVLLTLGVVDAGGLAASGSVAIDVTPVDDAPQLLANAGLTVDENSSGNTIGPALLRSSDVDSASAQLVYTVNVAPSHGSLRLNGAVLAANGSFTQADIDAGRLGYTHDGSETTADGFDFSLDDGQGLGFSGRFEVTVIPVNRHAPVITSAAAVTVLENGTAVGQLTASDADLPAAALRFAIVGGADAARFTIDVATGVLAFVAAPDFEAPADADADGVYELVVAASDGGLVGLQALTVTVGNVNEAPTLGLPGAQRVAEDGTLRFGGAWGNAIRLADPDGSNLAMRLVASVTQGSLSMGGQPGASSLTLTGDLASLNAALDGLRFDPDANFNGSVVLSLAFDDGAGLAVQGSVAIAVTPVDDAPQLVRNGGLTLAENELGTPIGPGQLLATDIDSAPAEIVYTLVGAPAHGSLRLGGALLAASDSFTQADIDAGRLRYDHDGSETTADGFGFSLDGGRTVSRFAIGITPVDDQAPEFSSAAAVALAENSLAVLSVAASDADGPGPIVYAISGGADAALFRIDAASGALRFIAAPDFEAPADAAAANHYVVTVSARSGAFSSTQTITVDVLDRNEAPLALDGTAALDEDSVYRFSAADFGFRDADAGDALGAVRIESLPASGTLSFGGAALRAGQVIAAADLAQLSWRPAPDENGSANALTFSVADRAGLWSSAPAVLRFAVAAVNDAPTIVSDGGGAVAQVVVDENSRAVTTVAATDVDLPPATLVYRIAGGADAARFAIDAASGTLSFVNAPDFEAPTDADADNVYELVVEASDGTLATQQALRVAVRNVDEAPASADVRLGTPEDMPRRFSAAEFGFSDPDAGDTLGSLLVEAIGGQGSFRLADATPLRAGQTLSAAEIAGLVFTPAPDGNGAAYATLRVRVADAAGHYAAAASSLTLDVSAVDDAPQPLAEVGLPDLAPAAGGSGAPEAAAAAAPRAAPPVAAAVLAPLGSGADPRPLPAEEARLGSSTEAAAPPARAVAGTAALRPSRGNANAPVPNLVVELQAEDVGRYGLLAVQDIANPGSRIAERSAGSADEAGAEDTGSGEAPGALAVQAVRAAGTALTAGTVWWALRAGGLMASLLVVLPAWRHVDLLAVLPDDEDDPWERLGEGDAADDEAARDERAVRRVFESTFDGEGR